MKYFLLIQEGTDDTADTAHIHDTGDTEVQVTGLLRQDFTGTAEQQGDTLHDGTGEERYKVKHLLALLLAVLAQGDLVGDKELRCDDEEQDNTC